MKYITKIEQIETLSEEEKQELTFVAEKFDFRCNEYYMSLINWNDPDDPIRRTIIPSIDELDNWGRLDPSDENTYSIMPGLEHKYNSTVLMLVSNICEGICRYCFRKRIFINPQSEYLHDIPAAIQYIKEHIEVTNVLITGGDPLVLNTSKLEEIISRLMLIEHVHIVRIGTRMPVFNPFRIIEDPDLLRVIEKYSDADKKIYIMTHFIHPRELTDVAVKGITMLQKAGAIVTNQMPLIRGINTDYEVLAELLKKLSFVGAVPYYIFQCRPALGNKAYTVPIEEGHEIIEKAKSLVSGLAKRARFVMSHSSGKIEIIGKDEQNTYFKYHRAANDLESGRIMILKSNPQAYWLDDYQEILQEYPNSLPYRIYGPE
jgi:KamA family protein